MDIDVDEFVPCLKNSKTGEIVDTVAEKVDKKSLKGYNIKNGWYIDWNKVPDDVEVHALKVKGSERIEGLVGLRKDNNAQAMYIHWGVAAPDNNKVLRVRRNILVSADIYSQSQRKNQLIMAMMAIFMVLRQIKN